MEAIAMMDEWPIRAELKRPNVVAGELSKSGGGRIVFSKRNLSFYSIHHGFAFARFYARNIVRSCEHERVG
jgi:hypothetical protein